MFCLWSPAPLALALSPFLTPPTPHTPAHQSGKALLLGALLGCARHALTLSAAMCAAKSPFAALAAGDRDAADRVRLAMASPAAKGLAAGALCDPLLVVDAYEGWRAALQSGGPRAAAQHCRLAFLDPDVLAVLHDTRGQLAQLLCAAGWFGGDAAAADAPHSPWNRSPVPPAQLLRDAVLCGALASQVAAGSPDDGGGGGDGGRSVWAVPGLGDVCVHPSSALHGVRSLARATPFLLYLEANKTHAVFVRDVSAVSPAGLALFGPPLALQHAQGAATLGPSGAAAGLRLAVDAQTGVLLKALRGLLERGLAQCLASRAPQPLDQDLLRAVAAVLRDNPVPVV